MMISLSFWSLPSPSWRSFLSVLQEEPLQEEGNISPTSVNRARYHLLLMCTCISVFFPALMAILWGYIEQVKGCRAIHLQMQWVATVLSPNTFTGVSKEREQLDRIYSEKCLLVAFYLLCTTCRHYHWVSLSWPAAQNNGAKAGDVLGWPCSCARPVWLSWAWTLPRTSAGLWQQYELKRDERK